MEIAVEDIILEQLVKYPQMQAQDALLLLYQGAGLGAGGEAYKLALAIEAEGSVLNSEQLVLPYTEDLGKHYCRMNLSVLQVLPAGVIGKMTSASGKEGAYDKELFRWGLDSLLGLCRQGRADFSEARLNKLLVGGIPCHSSTYLREYTPAYRVVRREYAKYLDLFVKISRLLYRGGEVTVAIEGGSAAGKSTLAKLISSVFDANCFCTEDFIRGGSFSWEVFEEQVCSKLNTGKPFVYHRGNPAEKLEVSPKRLNIVEGVYSMHPALEKYYEIKVFLDVSPLTQTKRILRDFGEEGLMRFTREKATRENAYLEAQGIQLRSDLVFT